MKNRTIDHHSTLPQYDTTVAVPNKKRDLKFRVRLCQWLSQPIVEVVAAAAVLLSTLLVALSTLNDLPLSEQRLISATLLLLDILFAMDFFGRWYTKGHFQLIYLTQPLALIDIVVVILPLLIGTVMPLMEYIMNLRMNDASNGTTDVTANENILSFMFNDPIAKSYGLQNLLLLRVLRLRRVLIDMKTFGKFAKALGMSKATSSIKPHQLQLARVLLSIFTLISVASGVIYTAEHNVNPQFTDYFTALYFALTSLTTVGYGDITPVTPAGRLAVCVSIVIGVATIPAQAAMLVEALLELQRDSTGVSDKTRSATQFQQQQQKQKQKQLSEIERSGIEVMDKKDTDDWEMGPGVESTRICSRCEEPSHRIDANFCWSCGNQL